MAPIGEWVEDEFLQRASHALFSEDGTWLVDPVDGGYVDELENVVGIVQLLDRHNRDCAAIADRSRTTASCAASLAGPFRSSA